MTIDARSQYSLNIEEYTPTEDQQNPLNWLRLVVQVAHQCAVFFPPKDSEGVMDYIAIGNLNLGKIIDAYRPESGFAMSTYLVASLRSEIFRGAARINGLDLQPLTWQRKLARQGHTIESLSAAQISEYLGISQIRAANLQQWYAFHSGQFSLNHSNYEMEIAEKIPDYSSVNPLEYVCQKETLREIIDILRELNQKKEFSKKQLFAASSKLGLIKGLEDATYEEIGIQMQKIYNCFKKDKPHRGSVEKLAKPVILALRERLSERLKIN